MINAAGRDLYVAGGNQTITVAAPAPPPPLRATLPVDAATFTGRAAEVSAITGSVGRAAVHAIEGMPGIGKTTLAVHVAHRMAAQFPDGRLFLDLHAHTPGIPPTPPALALAKLLVADGVDARHLPADPEGLAALWRDRTATRTQLLVLDNAADSAQIIPLLLTGPASLVLVTSRRRLGDLPAGSAHLCLDEPSPDQAAAMFRAAAGDRPAPDEAVLAELVELCGRLPLAISIMARVHAQHPTWSQADLLEETRDSVLRTSAERDTVAAAFDVSLRYLPAARRRFLVLLALHPGDTVAAHAAAALAATTPAEAATHLNELWRDNLLIETGRRRYRTHDLVRAYSLDRAGSDLAAGERGRAVERAVDHYQNTALLAARCLERHTRPGPQPTGSVSPDVGDYTTALTWLRTERPNLRVCLEHAVAVGQLRRVVALTAGMTPLLRQDGPWVVAVARHTAAAAAADRLGDRIGQANALDDLGVVLGLADDYPASTAAFDQALALYRAAGERLGEANALSDLGIVRRLTGDYGGAAQALTESLAIFEDLGDRRGRAMTLNHLAIVRRSTGMYAAATANLATALDLFEQIGDERMRATVLTNLGSVRRLIDDYPGATAALEDALSLYRRIADQLGQANALTNLGAVHIVAGHHATASTHLNEALNLYRALGDPRGEANAVNHLSATRLAKNDALAAARMATAAAAIYRRIGDTAGLTAALTNLGDAHRAVGDYRAASGTLQQALELSRSIGDRAAEAAALFSLGHLSQAQSDPKTARHHYEKSRQLFAELGRREDERRVEARQKDERPERGTGCPPVTPATGPTLVS